MSIRIERNFTFKDSRCTVSMELPAVFGVLVPAVTWEPGPPHARCSNRERFDLDLLMGRVLEGIVVEALAKQGNSTPKTIQLPRVRGHSSTRAHSTSSTS